jgi:hypothetical protein
MWKSGLGIVMDSARFDCKVAIASIASLSKASSFVPRLQVQQSSARAMVAKYAARNRSLAQFIQFPKRITASAEQRTGKAGCLGYLDLSAHQP